MKYSKYKRGSNQHRKVVKNHMWDTFYYGFLIVSVIVIGYKSAEALHMLSAIPFVERAYAQQSIVSPVGEKKEEAFVPETTEQEKIADEIKKVFGVHADKAFKVLSCENSSLNPEAVNTAGNVPEGSRDIGVFQVNEYWQKVHAKFLFNWKTNIQIAYQIFEDSGYSFKMWTCGKKFGI